MAYIYRKPKPKQDKDKEKQIAQKYVYNTPMWLNLRNQKLQNNPLCEECYKNNIISAASEVHHITPFLNGTNIQQIQFLGFDYNNLMSLCFNCHKDKHKK